jgi:hypothetical protein
MSNAYPRMAPPVVAERWDPPAKPDGSLPSIADAYRQTQFQLGGDLRLLAEAMNLQLQAVRESSGSRNRTLRMAVTMMYWSRAFLSLSEAATALTRGAYPVCPLLVRGACEAIAAQIQAGGDEHTLFLSWVEQTLVPNERHRGTDIGVGNYFAGSTLTRDQLGPTYRAAAELSRQHFGATLVEVAPESNRQRIAPTFADQSFHFGWAQLVLGWLLKLCSVELELITANIGPAPTSDATREAAASIVERIAKLIADSNRCKIEELDDEGVRRFVVQNFRRQSGGAPTRLLL